jgi:TonB family protein
VLESGEVANARVKRSSSFAHVDRYALEWIKGMKYNARAGCGVIEIETSVSIQWTGGE